MSAAVLGIDAGTRGIACVLFDERGRELASAWEPWPFADDEGFRIIDPAGAERALATAGAVAREHDVAVIGVTSQRTGVVFLGEDGAPLLISPNADGRGVLHGPAIDREHGDLLWRVTGRAPAMLWMPARLRAVPGLPVRAVLSLSDWILALLTGERATEPTQAAELGVFDLAAGAWSEDVLAALGIDRSLLPSIVEPGAVVGTVRDARWGPAVGTPVVPAGADTQCALVGLGVTEPGEAAVVAGTTLLTGVVREEPRTDDTGRAWTSPMPVPGRWIREAHCGEAGSLLDWFAGVLGTDAAGLAAEADEGAPGAGGVLLADPYPSDPRAFVLVKRGVVSFAAPVLALGRPRADIARAAFEGIAFGAVAGLERLRDAHGAPSRVVAAGGVSRSGAFRAALAGAAGRSIRVASGTQTSALGAAIIAAGAHRGGLAAASEAMADRGIEVSPDPSHGYAAHYAAWHEVARRAQAEGMRAGGDA